MRKALIGVAVVAVVAVAVWAVMNYPPKPAGKATGSVVKPKAARGMQKALWEELAQHEDAFLDAYAEQFQAMPNEAQEVLAAYSELSYQITGFGGLWRKTVPDKYFGCAANDHMPICKKFKQVHNSFSKWDKLQEQIMELDTEKQARKFLKKNGKELQEYIRYYVPKDESFSAVQATPFFSENLASSM